MKGRLLIAHLLITLGVFGVFHYLIGQKEAVVRHGATLLLRLAPVDPRSLMQGDYMRLDYEVSRSVLPNDAATPVNGVAVVKLDAAGVASFARLDDGQPLAPDERRLRYHYNGQGRVRLGAESYFFQEGDAARFEKAKYGELKAAPDGSSVLIGLRDEQLQPIPKRVLHAP